MTELATATAYLDEHGFIYFRFKDGAEVTLSETIRFVQVIEEIAEDQKRGVILDAREARVTTTKECRQYIGTDEEALKWRTADAIIVSSLHVRLIANFYMKFDTPEHPVKVFTNLKEARNWLSEQSKKTVSAL